VRRWPGVAAACFGLRYHGRVRSRLSAISLAGLIFASGPCAPAQREIARSPVQPAAAQPAPSPAAPARIDFQSQIQPILAAHCQPCHFPGGKMYDRLPFDRPDTIRTLGDKMFTRIKDERESALLRSFLAQKP
jgi:hypothetical protein